MGAETVKYENKYGDVDVTDSTRYVNCFTTHNIHIATNVSLQCRSIMFILYNIYNNGYVYLLSR